MSSAPSRRRYTPQEYLELEQRAEFRSEYFDGRMYAMAGASLRHVRITRNLTNALTVAFQGGPCEAFSSEVRVLIEETGLYTYPDILVTCEDLRLVEGPTATLLNPSLIVEILSQSTESYDRGKKFGHYRRVPTLREYVLIAQDEPRVECWVRQGPLWSGLKLLEFSGLDEVARFGSIECTIPLREIYQGVDFPSPVKDDLSR